MTLLQLYSENTILWNINISSINVNGINTSYKNILNQIKNNHITFIQESKLNSITTLHTIEYYWNTLTQQNEKTTIFFSEQLYQPKDFHLIQKRNNGVITIINPYSQIKNIKLTEKKISNEQYANRYMVVEGYINNTQKIYMHNIYAPVDPKDRIEFFQLLNSINYEQDGYHIVGGDFNCTIDSTLDQSNLNNKHISLGNTELMEWMNKLHLMDTWRIMNPTKKTFTSPNNKNRIDYIFIQQELLNQSNFNSNHKAIKFADHLSVNTNITNFKIKKKKGPWKCPSYMYSNDKFKELLTNHLNYQLNKLESSENIGIIWDNFKTQLKKDTKILENAIRIKEQNLEDQQYNKIKEILKAYEYNPENINREIEKFIKIRNTSKKNYVESNYDFSKKYEEKCNKHFLFNYEKSQSFNFPITSVRKNNGQISYNKKEIINHHTQFWGELFQSKSNCIKNHHATYTNKEQLHNMFFNNNSRKLSNSQETFMILL